MKPFPFTSLAMPDGNQSAATERNDLNFPSVAFDLPGSAADKVIEPTYSADDLERAVEEARKETALDVEAQTRAVVAAELAQRQTHALEAIRNQLNVLEGGFQRRSADLADLAQSVAKIMGQAIIPKALESHPLADIAETLRHVLLRLVDQPSVEIRLEADLVDQMADLSMRLADETGFQGKLSVVPDPALGAGDAKLIWSGGSASRDLGRMKEEIDMLIDAWFAETGFSDPRTIDEAEGAARDEHEDPPQSLKTESEPPEEGCAS